MTPAVSFSITAASPAYRPAAADPDAVPDREAGPAAAGGQVDRRHGRADVRLGPGSRPRGRLRVGSGRRVDGLALACRHSGINPPTAASRTRGARRCYIERQTSRFGDVPYRGGAMADLAEFDDPGPLPAGPARTRAARRCRWRSSSCWSPRWCSSPGCRAAARSSVQPQPTPGPLTPTLIAGTARVAVVEPDGGLATMDAARRRARCRSGPTGSATPSRPGHRMARRSPRSAPATRRPRCMSSRSAAPPAAADRSRRPGSCSTGRTIRRSTSTGRPTDGGSRS